MSVALSDLNRAALGGREQYGFVHWAAGCYVLVIGGYSVAAYIDAGEGFRAAMCAGAQLLAIVCAVLARRALTGQMALSALLCAIGALGCAWWAAQGLQHAWESNGSEINGYMVVFLAALEPGLFVLAEHIKEGREALRTAHMKAEQEQAEELARIRAREQRQRPVLATSGGMALAALPTGANASELALVPAQPSERPAIVSTNPGYASPREHAVALKMADPKLTQERAHQLTGAPRSTIGKWWRDAGLTASQAA